MIDKQIRICIIVKYKNKAESVRDKNDNLF